MDGNVVEVQVHDFVEKGQDEVTQKEMALEEYQDVPVEEDQKEEEDQEEVVEEVQVAISFSGKKLTKAQDLAEKRKNAALLLGFSNTASWVLKRYTTL